MGDDENQGVPKSTKGLGVVIACLVGAAVGVLMGADITPVKIGITLVMIAFFLFMIYL
jgi:hypothetical protein